MANIIKMEQLHPLHKQLGNHIIEFTNGVVNGYEILEYANYRPTVVKLVKSINNPADRVLSMDTAYDRLFGAPTAPNFNKILN